MQPIPHDLTFCVEIQFHVFPAYKHDDMSFPPKLTRFNERITATFSIVNWKVIQLYIDGCIIIMNALTNHSN